MADVPRLPPGGDEQANLSLHAAHLLRDRYARHALRINRKGRPRARYLADRAARTATGLVSALTGVAVITGATGLVALLTGAAISRAAAVVQVSLAIVVGGAALATSLARRSEPTLLGLGAGGLLVAELGWGLVGYLSGGAASPWLLVPVGVVVVGVGLVPLPPRVALALAVAAYASLLVASPLAPPWAHLLVAASSAGAWAASRSRHRRSIATFLRLERMTASVARMKRTQEQLVLVEKLEALRVLVGGIAHELNNALAVAMASTTLAAKNVGSPDAAAAALKRAEGGLVRIRSTVERLRRFAMASEGVLESADVAAMLDFALESAIGRARSGVAIERHYDPNVGAIQCHVAALAEALTQVARNAVDAMPAGGSLRATVRAEGDRVALSVSDDGKGIAPDAMKRIFDPYWRATIAGGAGAGQKSGMGLAAVYGIVTALGGSVRVTSEEGQGTTVTILVPRRGA